jgi:hypothetical protein
MQKCLNAEMLEYKFPKLKGNENYESWKVEISSALKSKGIWWVTSGKLEKPEIPASDVTAAEEVPEANRVL